MATIIGTTGNDSGPTALTGTNGDDTILGLGGSDTINGNGGNDVIVAGSGGSDTINGGAGSDTLVLGGNFAAYTITFSGGNIVLTLGSTIETVSGVETIAFDDRAVTVVGAGSELTSLQDAVDASAGGATLLVAPGDYTGEGIITVADKTLEIRGALAGTSPITGAATWSSADHTLIDSFVTTGTAGVVLDGVELRAEDGDSASPAGGLQVLGTGGVTVRNSIIAATQFENAANGIEVSSVDGDVTVDSVLFTGFTTDPSTTGTYSGYGIYLNPDSGITRTVSITNSTFDLRGGGGDADMRSYGVAFDGYGIGNTSLNITGNTFNDLTWGMLFWDSGDAINTVPNYSGISGNTFTDTNEAVGNIRNLTDHVIETGSNISNGVLYQSFKVGTADDDTILGSIGADLIAGNGGIDIITGGAGDDTIYGGLGNDTVNVDVSTDGADAVDLGAGNDKVNVGGAGEIRLTFTSAEVGNDLVNDGGSLTNQDGGLAVRLQAEDGAGGLTGPLGRYDDEGIIFVATGGTTIDVRDLVSGAQRGNAFTVARLGTSLGDTIDFADQSSNQYVNLGGGDDSVTAGSGDDFLVGGTGADSLDGGAGEDSFIGGGGADTIAGGADDDLVIHDVTTAGADRVDLGSGDDTVNVSSSGGAPQIRLTFTSAEVGNGSANDGSATAPQDGELAVRLQAEDNMGALTGAVSRFDDEGITFIAAEGTTFDVRDLTSGTPRGDQFNAVTLGTNGADTINAGTPQPATLNYYVNAGQGNDTVTSQGGNDFLVGGAGNDTLDAGAGADSYLGGAGNDTLVSGAGNDTLDGGADFDTATFTGNLAAYTITNSAGPGGYTVSGPGAGTDTLISVEALSFADAGRVLVVDDSGDTGFTSIQDAVDEARAGDTILVLEGTYNETVNLNKDVTLLGANAGINGSAGGRGAESTITGGIYVTGNGATIDGFKVTGGVQAGGAERPYGVLVGADGVTLVNCLLDGGEVPDGGDGGSRPFGTVAGVEDLSVSRNLATNWMQGAYIVIGTTGTIASNTFDDNGNHIVTESVSLIITTNFFGDSIGSRVAVAPFVDVDLNDVIAADNVFNAGTGSRLIGVFPNEPAGNSPQVISGTNYAESFLGDQGSATGPFVFNGNGGNDTLIGSNFGDTLNGGTGNDALTGRGGNDIYHVDTAGDSVTEAANQGTDTVQTTLATYTLGVNVENLTFTGSGSFVGIGNALANTITGGAGNDTLTGAGGVDTTIGGAGNDSYVVNVLADVIIDSSGTDLVSANLINVDLNNYTAIENGRLLGTANTNLTGSGGDNTLYGNSGDNVVTGGGGRDIIYSGGGLDRFDFNDVSESGPGAARDTIIDFVESNAMTGAPGDIIDLLTIDARTSTAPNNAFTFIGTAAFTAEGQVRYAVIGGNTVVTASNDADAAAEFEIVLRGVHSFSDADFVL